MNRVQKHWFAVFVWMAFIFVMSTDVGSSAHSSTLLTPIVLWINPNATPEQFELVHFLFRKAGHLSEYAVLGFLILRAVRASQRPGSAFPTATALLITLVIAASYAATDEFHQTFVPGRTPAVGDVLIDSGGAALGMLFSLVRSSLSSLLPD